MHYFLMCDVRAVIFGNSRVECTTWTAHTLLLDSFFLLLRYNAMGRLEGFKQFLKKGFHSRPSADGPLKGESSRACMFPLLLQNKQPISTSQLRNLGCQTLRSPVLKTPVYLKSLHLGTDTNPRWEQIRQVMTLSLPL